MATITSAAPGLKEPFCSPTWMWGVQVIGPFSYAFPGPLAGNWIQSGAAGTGTSSLIWDTGNASGRLTVPQGDKWLPHCLLWDEKKQLLQGRLIYKLGTCREDWPFYRNNHKEEVLGAKRGMKVRRYFHPKDPCSTVNIIWKLPWSIAWGAGVCHSSSRHFGYLYPISECILISAASYAACSNFWENTKDHPSN